MKRPLSIIKVGIFCGVLLFLTSCIGKKTYDSKVVNQEVEKLSCLVVMPTRNPIATTKNMKYVDAETLEKGADFLDSLIADELNVSEVSRIIGPSHIETLVAEVAGGNLGMMRAVGKKVNCGTVLYVTVQRFKQRLGGEYAVDSPASAAFEMRLIDIDSGTALWTGTFNETQESLLNNLFSFDKAQSRGFKWITVEELVQQGVHERLAECPYLF